MQALANEVESAKAVVDCTGYQLSLTAIHLTPGSSYSLPYSLTLTPEPGAPESISGTVPVVGPANGTYSTTVTGTFGSVHGEYGLSGNVSLVRNAQAQNTIRITFSPSSLSCPLSVTCPSVTTGKVGAPFHSGSLHVTGGKAPYTFAIEGMLPAGLTLNPSTGDVAGTPKTTGKFTVKATDANGAATLSCSIVIDPSTAGTCTTGAANAYSLVALKRGIDDPADITGRIAAAGAVDQVKTVGSGLRNGDPWIALATVKGIPYAIVAAGGIPDGNFINLNAGGSVYSSAATKAILNFANESAGVYAGSKLIVGRPSPVDFPALDSLISNLSSLLSSAKANGLICHVDNSGSVIPAGGCPAHPIYFDPGSQHYNPSWLVLYGESTTINVFNVTQEEFQDASKNLDIEVPKGSTAIVNVAGLSDTLRSGIYFQGRQVGDANAGNLVFNFPEAAALTIDAQMDASVLAPKAVLSGISQMGGVFVAASVGSTGEVHYVPFAGTLPCAGK